MKKREKRKKQKTKRKLKYIKSELHHRDVLVACEEPTINEYSSVNDEYGVDSAVVQMRIEDNFKEQDYHDQTCTDDYSKHYLTKCREVLMCKVEAYQQELARERLEKKKLLASTEEKIQSIQEFYKKMILVPNRTGTIARKALSSTHTAKQFLKELVTNNTILRP